MILEKWNEHIMTQKILALDIGNVCISIDPNRFAKALGATSFENIDPQLMHSIDIMERTTNSESQWLKECHRVTENKFNDNQIRHAYNLILGEDIPGMADFLKDKIENNWRVIFFSDISERHLNGIYRELSFANLISGGIFSYEVGAKKPETGMYKAFEKQYGKPDLYLDDKEENIEAGLKQGWNAHIFTTTRELLMVNC